MARIFLSPSSQDHNIGVISGYVESVYCNKIADATEKYLKLNGHIVGRNNPKETYVEHCQRAKDFNADFIIAIHTNAGEISARGLQVGCITPTNPNLKSTMFADKIMRTLIPIMPTHKGILIKYNFYEINHADENVPIAYLELAFHSNSEDCKFIMNNVETIGKEIAKGACLFTTGKFIEVKSIPAFVPYTVKVTASSLNVRAKASIFSKVVAKVQFGDVFTIVGVIGSWGKLKSGIGFINLKYTKKF